MSRILWIIYNSSIKEGTFPHLWKTGIVTPNFKSGDRSTLSNYRPICVGVGWVLDPLGQNWPKLGPKRTQILGRDLAHFQEVQGPCRKGHK